MWISALPVWFTNSHILLKAYLFSLTGHEKGKEEAVSVLVYACWISSEFNLRRCEVNGNLFCKSAADSCSGPFASISHVSSFIGQEPSRPAGFTPPTGKPAGKSGRNKERRRLRACRPPAVCSLGVSTALRHRLSPKMTSPGSVCGWLLVASAKELQQGCGVITSSGVTCEKEQDTCRITLCWHTLSQKMRRQNQWHAENRGGIY